MSLREFLSKILKVIVCQIFVQNGAIIIKVNLYKKDRLRCPICYKKCKKHNSHPHTTRWLCEEFFGLKCFIEYAPNRIKCCDHGKINEFVPWADYRSRFSKFLVNKIVVLSLYANKTFAGKICGIKNWKTINNIVNAVLLEDNLIKPDDIFERIGIDETAYKKGHKYITIVYNHDTNNVIWHGEGKKKETLDKFFKTLSKKQRKSIKTVTADGAPWIKKSVQEWCPNAVIIMDPFHIMQWVTDALNNTRVKLQHEKEKQRTLLLKSIDKARGVEKIDISNKLVVCEYELKVIKESRAILLKNHDSLNEQEKQKLKHLMSIDCPELIEAWNIKEMLHDYFKLSDCNTSKIILDEVLKQIRRSSNAEMTGLYNKLFKRYDDILSYKKFCLSNAPIESLNTRIKVIIRNQFGCNNLINLGALISAIGKKYDFMEAYHMFENYTEFLARKV
jgi:transposase